MPSCRDCFISEKTFAKVPPFLAFLGSPEATLVANTPCAPLAGGNAVVDGCGKAAGSAEPAAEEYTLMTIDTIINGKVGPALPCAPTACPDPPPHPERPCLTAPCSLQDGVFPGLIPILNSYLENMEVDVDTRCSILNYLKLIKKRASGMAPFAFLSFKTKKSH